MGWFPLDKTEPVHKQIHKKPLKSRLSKHTTRCELQQKTTSVLLLFGMSWDCLVSVFLDLLESWLKRPLTLRHTRPNLQERPYWTWLIKACKQAAKPLQLKRSQRLTINQAARSVRRLTLSSNHKPNAASTGLPLAQPKAKWIIFPTLQIKDDTFNLQGKLTFPGQTLAPSLNQLSSFEQRLNFFMAQEIAVIT